MRRILKNEIGRCKYCGSSVVVSPFYIGHGKQRRLVYCGACCNKECGHRTAGASTKEGAVIQIKRWGILMEDKPNG